VVGFKASGWSEALENEKGLLAGGNREKVRAGEEGGGGSPRIKFPTGSFRAPEETSRGEELSA